MTLATGTRLGHYEIRSRIGAGGMGEVYLAEDTKLRRKVALKLLSEDVTKDADRLRRFEQEAQAASALNHPNILVIYEIGTEGDAHFIATEFIEGGTLRQHLHREQLPIHESLDIATQVASAVSAAHRAGIIHRDIKPENIMIRPDGYVKVLDFGLAKLTEQHSSSIDTEAPTVANANTDPGTVLGTLNYMSPEQARGKPLDARSDIFSLGVVIYEMVAGRAPFEGETSSDVMSFILHKEPGPLARYTPDVPAELERIVAKALTKDREERYQSAKDLLIDLKRLKQKQEVDAELERSVSPESISRPPAAATGSGTAVATASEPEVRSEGTAIRTTSSAEYIVSEIRRHKLGALLAIAAFIALTAVVTLFVYPRYFATGGDVAIRSVAVMPFQNVSGNPETEYLSDGISESLINSLSRLPLLKVVARNSSFKYKGQEIDVREVARALGVEGVITGRVVERGGNLQISVEMVNAREGMQMWGEQYSRRAADVQAVQSEISREITERLRLRLTGAQEEQLGKRATENPQAFQLYLNGEFYSRKSGFENIKSSLDNFNQALALDPKFALAWAGVARAYRYLAANGRIDPKEANPKAKEATQKALGLDESLAEAHMVLGQIKQDEWDWVGAEREYRRAIDLNPSLARAHNFYADYLVKMGRPLEALAEVKRAQELDPLYSSPKGTEGEILCFARRYDEAIQQFQNVIKLEANDSFAHAWLGVTYAAKEMYGEAIEQYQKQMSIDGETTSALCYLGYALARSGKRGEAEATLGKLKKTKEYVSPAELAILYAGLGDKEGALSSLQRAYDAHDLQMHFLNVDPHYDSLRGEPRFQDLIRRVGLPQ
jgi:eukaryotic-like serine/threonine-protein kinase